MVVAESKVASASSNNKTTIVTINFVATVSISMKRRIVSLSEKGWGVSLAESAWGGGRGREM